MPSSEKTEYLNLNSWIEEDKPKRADFVNDNEKIDYAVKMHFEDDSIHFSKNELGGGGSFVMGTYAGNGASSRIIALEDVYDFAFVFMKNQAFFIYSVLISKSMSYFSIAMQGVDGIAKLQEKNLIISDRDIENSKSRMNDKLAEYSYIAFKA